MDQTGLPNTGQGCILPVSYTHLDVYKRQINAFAFILVPTAIILRGLGVDTTTIIANVIHYVVIAPLIASNVMKAMYLSQDLFMAKEAVERLEQLLSLIHI